MKTFEEFINEIGNATKHLCATCEYNANDTDEGECRYCEFNRGNRGDTDNWQKRSRAMEGDND